MIKREVCEDCQRAQKTCICGCVKAIDNETHILILQHPLEVKQAKGSGRLLHLCLPNSELMVGEAFPQDLLHAAVFADQRQPILLYPDTVDCNAVGISAPPQLNAQVLMNPSQLRLVILDATWRKSRKMLYLNPALQALPRLPLNLTQQSRYRIRKAHAPEQLSTMEACAYALMQIESNEGKYQSLLQSFDQFIEQQLTQKMTQKMTQQISKRGI